MTTAATLLPRREQALPAPGVDGRSNRLVTNGRLATGEPAGSIFFWSHTRFFDDFGFGLHPHEGFEIISVILEGHTAHYDTVTDEWYDLAAGDLQIIRSGSGLFHQERAYAGARVFQIWVDPGFATALQRPASYSDHPATDFPRRALDGGTTTTLIGPGGPVETFTDGLSMRRVEVPAGARVDVPIGPERFAVAFVVDGAARLDGLDVGADDAIALDGVDVLRVEATQGCGVFVLAVPVEPGYRLVRDGA